MQVLEALVAGERNPRTLAGLAKGSLVKKTHTLTEALTGLGATPCGVRPDTIEEPRLPAEPS
ncbi:hypothetical protein [Actinomadura madurae]|uniref:hypothetical protein n=1 Tax=Actinomadura madurae TaxID=1993 RepID=UPI000D8FC47B|nr:hypothetical protein [Actinomadura madurae]SPT60134.1 Uncharacterised protein [Actinomadura madurae]